MLQWQHLFSSAILQRGREYYKKNKVRSLIQDGELYYEGFTVTTYRVGEKEIVQDVNVNVG